MPVSDLKLSRLCRAVLDDESGRFSLSFYQCGKGGLVSLIDRVKESISKTDLSDDLDDRIERLLRKTLTVKSAVTRLREAGLHVHQLDCCGLIGGSHVDASSGQRMVQNGFMVREICELWELDLLGVLVSVGFLEEAVEKILANVQPGVDVPDPTPRSTGPQYY